MSLDTAERLAPPLFGKTLRIVDVRSPGEFAAGHIPGARNLPLFTNDQRAEIGRRYHRQGASIATQRGLQIARQRLPWLVQAARAEIGAPRAGRPVMVHCWRGGMRSRSVGWLLQQFGWEVAILPGGYKRYRRAVHQSFQRPLNLIVLSGLTGSGKTRLLHRLAESGRQVIDLEGLASHRGSAFGGIGLPPQPTVEQFENELARALESLDRSRPIWVEDESHHIGRVAMPLDFHRQLRMAPALFLNVPADIRLRLLVEEYGPQDTGAMRDGIVRIMRRLGGQNASRAINALERGDRLDCARILLDYYDRTYRNAMQSHTKYVRERTRHLDVADPTDDQVLPRLLDAAERLVST